MKNNQLNPNLSDPKPKNVLLLSVLFSICLKLSVGLSGYSGHNNPPTFGDFEAQRHWIETTFNLNLKDWYYYKPSYWLLDYPPLTAYHSYFLGFFFNLFEPSFIRLGSSEGLENKRLTFLMRMSSIITDLLFTYGFIKYFGKKQHRDVLLALINPVLVLVDHGHFQYNSFFLGLTLLTIYYLKKNKDILASVLFCLAINFKQMGLYYSLPVFIYLLSKCTHSRSIKLFLKLGTTVLLTNILLWLPFFLNDTYKQVFHRIFPIKRGLFEDKVANFWCLTNIIVKYKTIYSNETLLKLSTVFTLASCLPSLTILYRNKNTFVYSLAYVSLCFFLFGFQVHEKTIMLPLLPILLLNKEQALKEIFSNIALFSISPLLFKDQQVTNTFAVALVFNIINKTPIKINTVSGFLKSLLYLIIILLGIGQLSIKGTAKYPDLFLVINVCFSSVAFHAIALYLLYKQYIIMHNERKLKIQ